MADPFTPIFDAMKETAAAFVQATEANQLANEANRQANAALQLAGVGITKMADAGMHARGEREDLRETVHRLEGLVIQLGADVRALRDRPNP